MIKPQPMKIQCVKCSATMIIAPKSDVIFVPHCKKCGGDMKIVGGVDAISGIGSVLKSYFCRSSLNKISELYHGFIKSYFSAKQ